MNFGATRHVAPERVIPGGAWQSGQYRVLCPVHLDTRPSVTARLYDRGWRWRCWSCGWAGDNVDAYRAATGSTHAQAVTELAGAGGPVLPPGQLRRRAPDCAPASVDTVPADTSETALAFLARRGLASRAGSIEYAPSLDALAFWYGQACKLRSIVSKRFWWAGRPGRGEVYRPTGHDTQARAILCEGELDAEALHCAGLLGAVSVPHGASSDLTALDVPDEVVSALDDDEPGRAAYARLLGVRPRAVRLEMGGHKDPNEALLCGFSLTVPARRGIDK